MPTKPPPSYHSLNNYRDKLLRDLGAAPAANAPADQPHPAEVWATSGLMALTGRDDAPPTLCPVPLPHCADDTLEALRLVCNRDILPGVAGHRLLTERAALAGLRRRGALSTGGHCRLLPSADGMLAVNLARDSDWELVPAWLETTDISDWPDLAAALRERRSADLLARAILLGLAVADATDIPGDAAPWYTATRYRPPEPGNADSAPVVVDLTALWAGPLCSHLWQQAGARVIKVESERRPDGARLGEPAFFQLLNAGKDELRLPLHTPAGQQALRELIAGADIVLEAARPRALHQMGIVAEDILAAQPRLTWVSITGHGREGPAGNRVAFGDDAGVAAGLSGILHAVSGEWLICADAIADPLTGLHAALAGWHSWRAGGGALVALSLAGTVRHCITATAPADGDYRARRQRWETHLQQCDITAEPPQQRAGRCASTR